MGKWWTVTVMDGEGKRYSLDVNGDSSYDAAHLYLTHVHGNPSCGFPIPTTSTLFEVVTDGRIHHVQGARLKKWIENRRHEWKGPRGPAIQSAPDDRRLGAGADLEKTESGIFNRDGQSQIRRADAAPAVR